MVRRLVSNSVSNNSSGNIGDSSDYLPIEDETNHRLMISAATTTTTTTATTPTNAAVHMSPFESSSIAAHSLATTTTTTTTTKENESESETRRKLLSRTKALMYAFGAMGVLNNTSYVVMLACAKNISEGGTALVYLANVLPSMSVKASAPYWFDLVHYQIRLKTATYLMGCAFLIVALFSMMTGSGENDSSSSGIPLRTVGQLFGVAMISAQGGLGEASLLALAGKCDTALATAAAAAEEEEETPSFTEQQNNQVAGKAAEQQAILAPQQEQGRQQQQQPKKPSKCVCLTAFSSGTGLAGPVGYLWKVLFTEWLNWSLPATLFLATSLAVAYGSVFTLGLLHNLPSSPPSSPIQPPGARATISTVTPMETDPLQQLNTTGANHSGEDHNDLEMTFPHHHRIGPSSPYRDNKTGDADIDPTRNNQDPSLILRAGGGPHVDDRVAQPLSSLDETTSLEQLRQRPLVELTLAQRFRLVLGLWWYTVPLFTVYFAEYAIQSGAWTAMAVGSQDASAAEDAIHSAKLRNQFYEYSNWMYQLGVFLSRSSGTLCLLPLPILWLLPGLQVVNLMFFGFVASSNNDSDNSSPSIFRLFFHKSLYHSGWVLYSMALYTGLLGGAVYVHGYKRIIADTQNDPASFTEFALASTSQSESMGIVVADIFGLILQGCLYKINHIQGALITNCPV